MKPRAFLPMGLMVLSALALASQGITLKRTPKVGDKAKYKMSGALSAQGNDITISGNSTEEITKVEDGVVTKTSVQKLTIGFGGQDQDLPEQTQTTTSKLDGTPISMKMGDQDGDAGLRLAHVNMLFLPATPVEVGGTWSTSAPKDEKKGLPGYKVEYKLVGEEKVGTWDTYKITSKAAETEGDAPTKVEGTFWIDKATGQTVRSVLNLTDAVMGPAPVSGKVETNLQP